ncbi:hypothetical protein, partial [Erwinia tasmaniensis]|uniref:hypothetical protein n=1 Tax=Erwinia tasmaniensis TaxID=338565 RepID=UPI003A4DBE26
NTFQGFNVLKKNQESDNINFIFIDEQNGYERNELDANLLEGYPLFDKAKEDSDLKAMEEFEELKTDTPTEFNKGFYTLAY